MASRAGMVTPCIVFGDEFGNCRLYPQVEIGHIGRELEDQYPRGVRLNPQMVGQISRQH